MAKPRFTMVVLLIEDLPRSLAFYRRLGIEFPADADEKTDIGVDIGDGRTIIWTSTFERVRPRARDAARVIAGHARVLRGRQCQAVDALFEELTEAGHHGRRAPFLTDFDAYMCMVDDPDGNTVLITAG